MTTKANEPLPERIEVRTLRHRTKQAIPTSVLDELEVKEGDMMGFFRTAEGVLIRKVQVH